MKLALKTLFSTSLIFYGISELNALNFSHEFKQLEKNTFDAEPECWFNKSEVNIETISLFPKNCTIVNAILSFTSNSSKIPLEKLTSTFANLTRLHGGIWIENTSFTSLSFFDNLGKIIGSHGIHVSNNKKLSQAEFLFHLNFSNYCPVEIIKNVKLNAGSYCESPNLQRFIGYLNVSGNSEDCGCQSAVVTSQNLNSFQSCTALFGDLTISNFTGVSLMKSFSKIQNITGNVIISNTGFQNLSFFKSLGRLKSNNGYDIGFNVIKNPNMTRFGIDSLIYTYDSQDWYTFNFEKLHPSFCLTTEELQLFTQYNFKYSKLEAKHCQDLTRRDGAKVCEIVKLSDLDNDCIHIMGNVYINSGDEEYTDKLENVTAIYGCLIITNTSLTDLAFLENLKTIASLNESCHAINLIENTKLRNITLPNLKYPFSKSAKRIVIVDTARSIFESYSDCNSWEYSVLAKVTYNNLDCMNVQVPAEGFQVAGTNEETTDENSESSQMKCFSFYIVFVLFSNI